jgi:hypothetical protein
MRVAALVLGLLSVDALLAPRVPARTRSAGLQTGTATPHRPGPPLRAAPEDLPSICPPYGTIEALLIWQGKYTPDTPLLPAATPRSKVRRPLTTKKPAERRGLWTARAGELLLVSECVQRITEGKRAGDMWLRPVLMTRRYANGAAAPADPADLADTPDDTCGLVAESVGKAAVFDMGEVCNDVILPETLLLPASGALSAACLMHSGFPFGSDDAREANERVAADHLQELLRRLRTAHPADFRFDKKKPSA